MRVCACTLLYVSVRVPLALSDRRESKTYAPDPELTTPSSPFYFLTSAQTRIHRDICVRDEHRLGYHQHDRNERNCGLSLLRDSLLPTSLLHENEAETRPSNIPGDRMMVGWWHDDGVIMALEHEDMMMA